jgi:N-acyl-D-amino-acid deacylase
MAVAIAAVVVMSSSRLALAEDALHNRIRKATEHGIRLLQESQGSWYTKQSCSSCHHQYLPAMAFREAREHGIHIDESAAEADFRRTFNYADLDRAIQYTHIIEPAMGDGYRLVAANAAGVRPNLVTAVYAKHVASHQNPDGSWEDFRHRPPSSHSQFTMTALAMRSVQLYGHPSQKAQVQALVARSRHWLVTHTPRDTEERSYQLLGLLWAGTDRKTLDKAARALAATQRADGGWNSIEGHASDVYSTGEALVALHDAGGMAPTTAAWQRGMLFLLDSQAPDGSWHVVSRLHPPAPISPPYFESGYPYGHDQFISATGAGWAIMALARALGPAQAVDAPALPSYAPKEVEPWAETLLFGSEADLERLLASGFNPNSATASGGTTALMMAAPDRAKMRLLVARGANVNARTQTGYSALMVAAQYPGASDAMEWLLDQGADVRAPAGSSRPLFGAYPLFLAAYAGNAGILRRLLDGGDALNAPVSLIGARDSSPMIGAVRRGNLDVIRTLLDLGLPVDQSDSSGITPLQRAVFGNRLDVAQLLIARGADVNHVDKAGMTALLYAASIDFGDSKMIELLLKAGARTDARTTEGQTALDLARTYQHVHLIPPLQSHATY